MTGDHGHILLSADVVGLTFLCFGRSIFDSWYFTRYCSDTFEVRRDLWC